MKIYAIAMLVLLMGCSDNHPQQIAQLQKAVKELSDQNVELRQSAPGEQPETVKEIKRLQDEIKGYQGKLFNLEATNRMLEGKAQREGISPAASVINDEFSNMSKAIAVLRANVKRLEERMCRTCNKEHTGIFENSCR
jgi:chromosome segregation ATPase